MFQVERTAWASGLGPILCVPSQSGAASRSGELSRLVREGLVPLGLRVVVTSRPEGVKVEDFRNQFVILSSGDF